MVEAEKRFIEAFTYLMGERRLNMSAFADATNTKASTLGAFKTGTSNRHAKVEWFTELVEHYNVSAEWLLVGKGEMFRD